MKKKIIGLLFPSLLAVGLFANMRGANAKQADALSYETEISVGPGFFYDLDPTAGQYADAGATFWGEGYAFNSMGTFFRGETAEGWKGTLTSRKWTQHTQYVYFTWSGQNNSDAVNIRFYYDGCSGPIVIKNTAFVGNPMMLWYAKIPDEDYAKFTESGVQMSLELYDDADSDYGFHNFGYLHVNQTEEQVSNAMRYYLNHLKAPINDWEVEKHKEILNHYYYNGHLRNVFLRTVDSVDEDFENGNDFVNHWYLDYNYDNALDTNRHIDNVIGTDEYRLGSNMPFNKTGNGYFKGWYEGGDINQGYIDSDRPIYRFMSRPFVLKDTGLISLKMAGRAASLHVIDADTREDLAWADLRSFNDEGSQEIQALSGFNTVTMVRHYINLEEYVGKTIQLALADVYDSGWAASYFDELITDYKEYPVLDFEIVKQENETATSYKVYRDKYICSTPILVDPNGLKHPDGKANLEHEDNSPMYEAYRFLNEFFYLVDEDDNKYNLVKSYRLLSEEAKELVNKASDYAYEEGEEWYKVEPTRCKVIDTINNLLENYKIFFITFGPNGGTGEVEPLSVKDGERYTLPECSFTAPEGKEFDCWLVNDETKAVNDVIEVNDDVVIKALWKDAEVVVNTYTVSFNPNGGTGEMTSVTLDEGSEYTLPECTFLAPEGQEFDYWLVSEEVKQPGDKVLVNGDIEIKAIYKNIPVTTYTVIFNSNGGTGSMDPVTLEEGIEYTLPECGFTAPEGKEFDCWSVNNESKQPGDKIVVNGDLEVKALWKDKEIIVNTCKITFNPNGGTGSMNEITINEGDEYVLPECTFVAPNGKEFASWLVVNERKQPGDKIIVTSDLEVKALWQDIPVVTYTVTFNPNGGVGTMDIVTVNEGEQYILPECGFTAPEGQEFDGWLVSGEVKQPGETILVNNNLELTAKWEDITPIVVTYTISFNSNGGTGTMNPVTLNEGDEYVLPACTFTAPEGKEFASWTIGGATKQVGDKIIVNGNIEVKANWKTIQEPVNPDTPTKKGCGGSIIASSIVLSSTSLMGVALLLLKKNKHSK